MTETFGHDLLNIFMKQSFSLIHHILHQERTKIQFTWISTIWQNMDLARLHILYTHTRLTALFRDYPGEPVPER